MFTTQCEGVLPLLKELPASQKVSNCENVYGIRDLIEIAFRS